MADDKAPTTSDELRKDIDSGRTGDKVDFPDPAAAPLGTDAEASGNPPDAKEVKLATPKNNVETPMHWGSGGMIAYVLIGVGLLAVFAAIIVWAM